MIEMYHILCFCTVSHKRWINNGVFNHTNLSFKTIYRTTPFFLFKKNNGFDLHKKSKLDLSVFHKKRNSYVRFFLRKIFLIKTEIPNFGF